MKLKRVPTVCCLPLVASEAAVASCRGDERGEHRGELPVSNKAQNGSFRVPPGEISEELVNCLCMRSLTLPKFALGYENIGGVMSDENVCPAFLVECLAGHALKVRRQYHQEVVPERLL